MTIQPASAGFFTSVHFRLIPRKGMGPFVLAKTLTMSRELVAEVTMHLCTYAFWFGIRVLGAYQVNLQSSDHIAEHDG
jgi:hypothetical protein